jgi:hypothetical protein
MRSQEQRIKLKIKAAHNCLDCEFTTDFKQLIRPTPPAEDQKKGQKPNPQSGEKDCSKG